MPSSKKVGINEGTFEALDSLSIRHKKPKTIIVQDLITAFGPHLERLYSGDFDINIALKDNDHDTGTPWGTRVAPPSAPINPQGSPRGTPNAPRTPKVPPGGPQSVPIDDAPNDLDLVEPAIDIQAMLKAQRAKMANAPPVEIQNV